MTAARRRSSGPMRPCCMISEILEETGIDRPQLQALRRQILEGIILLCRWQLDRMERSRGPEPRRRPRRISVE